MGWAGEGNDARPREEFAAHLRRVMLQRRRLEVLPDLPTKTWQTENVEGLDEDTKALCDQLLEKLVELGIDIDRATEVVDVAKSQTVVFEMIALVRAALEDNRVDVYLQPIVSLPQRKLRFYEAFSRLRDSKGEIIMPKEYLYVAEPAGLMTVIDNLLLFRCVQVVRQLAKKNPGTAIFCNISGYSLRDHAFFPQFIEYMEANADLASQLVFEFAQSELQSCSAQEELSLERLAALGFGFSMDRVASLDVDFHALARFNFRFVKIDAKMLTAGAVPGAPVQAGDLKTFARRQGIDLIAEKIEDEKTVVDVLEYDVDFGQGYLFGEPAPMDEVLRQAASRGEASEFPRG